MSRRNRKRANTWRKRPTPQMNGKQYRREYWERIREDNIKRAKRARYGPRMRPHPVVVKGVQLEAAPNGERSYRDLGFKSYLDYLDSPHWQNVRRRYRQSGRPLVCFACGNRNYELHHRTYERIGQEQLDDLVPLCRDCHEGAHRLDGKTVDGRRVTISDAHDVLKQRRTEQEAA